MVLHIERAKRSQNFLRKQLDTGGIGRRIVNDYLSGSSRCKDAAQLQVSTVQRVKHCNSAGSQRLCHSSGAPCRVDGFGTKREPRHSRQGLPDPEGSVAARDLPGFTGGRHRGDRPAFRRRGESPHLHRPQC
jgi:hypothetical protein